MNNSMCIKLAILVLSYFLGNVAFAQVGSETSADQVKLDQATACDALLESFKHNIIYFNSDTTNDDDILDQVEVLMTDARSQAKVMNCAQQVNINVTTIDVSENFKTRIKQRVQSIVSTFAAVVAKNTATTLRISGPVDALGIR